VQTNGNNDRNASKPPANITDDLEVDDAKRLLMPCISEDALSPVLFSS
jgi:hypothetical protein